MRTWLPIALALSIALVLGCAVRQWAYEKTRAVRFELNQRNAFYWGDRIVHGQPGPGVAIASPGPATWTSFWRSYVAVYDADAANPVGEPHTLDYVPLRLLMAGAWVQYLNIAYGPVTQWRPEFARSFCAFSMGMELAGAAVMFGLVARWLKASGPGEFCPLGQRPWGRWEQAAAAAILVWLNPASIVDSHVWPHGQTWILAFYLLAVIAMIEQRFFLAGISFGVGVMFKGQMLLVAPVLILWPMFDRRWWGAARVGLGMATGIGLIVWPWVIHGSFAWARTGFAAQVAYTDTLRKGETLNVPAILGHYFHMTLHQHVIDRWILGLQVHVELRTVLGLIYAILLVCCCWGIARQARTGDRRLLVSIAAPWAIMFFILGQMDERYLVWSACFSAGAVAVGWRGLAAHAMLSLSAVLTMFEFLLINRPGVWTGALHALIDMNTLVWLMTAASVVILFAGSITNIKPMQRAAHAAGRPNSVSTPHNCPQRQYRFAVDLIQYLCEPRVTGREAAKNSFKSGDVLESLAEAKEVSRGEHEKEDHQRPKHNLQRHAQAQRADEKTEGEQPPDGKI
jgi:hypothetical protein